MSGRNSHFSVFVWLYVEGDGIEIYICSIFGSVDFLQAIEKRRAECYNNDQACFALFNGIGP